MSGLAAIPYLDICGATPVEAVRRYPERARLLVDAARDTFGLASRMVSALALPITERRSLSWLERTANPYLDEIRQTDALLKLPGVYTLNICFEWGCTSGVWPGSNGPALRRVLDWGFPLLGENLVVLRQRGKAGEFLNITWPGLSGSFQGLAPGRFACAINQAPMRKNGAGLLGDWLVNRRMVDGCTGLPPAHLLRLVLETAPDYAAAKSILCETGIAVPAIFILSGTRECDGCIIERTEEAFEVRQIETGGVVAANHFESIASDSWRARPIDSAGRARCARNLSQADFENEFAWFKPPIANVNSRVVFEANAANGSLTLMGTAGASAVTEIFRHSC